MERRRTFASFLRSRLLTSEERVAAVAQDLEALATELEDDSLGLDPAAAVATMRLLSEPDSPLLDRAAPTDELRSRVLQIRSARRSRFLRGQKPGSGRRSLAAELLANQRDHVVRLGVAAEHGFLEDELTVQCTSKIPFAPVTTSTTPISRSHPRAASPPDRRRSGAPSGDAVLDANVVAVGHERIVAQARIAA